MKCRYKTYHLHKDYVLMQGIHHLLLLNILMFWTYSLVSKKSTTRWRQTLDYLAKIDRSYHRNRTWTPLQMNLKLAGINSDLWLCLVFIHPVCSERERLSFLDVHWGIIHYGNNRKHNKNPSMGAYHALWMCMHFGKPFAEVKSGCVIS